jgi:hypothetical protein
MFTFMAAGLGAQTVGMPQWLASATVGAASQSAEVYDDARQRGMSHEQAMQLAKWGALIGTSEALGMGRLLDKLPANGFFAKAVAVLSETLEEGAQEFGQNAATNYLFDKPLVDGEALRAGAVGALLGFAGGAAHEALSGEHGASHHEGEQESPIPNLPLEQYTGFVERLSQVTGYPKEAIPGLIHQEVLHAQQRASETRPQPDGLLMYVQSPDGRLGVIQTGEGGKTEFREITEREGQQSAAGLEPKPLTAAEFDGLFPTDPKAYQPGTVELGRLQFLHDQGLLPEGMTAGDAVRPEPRNSEPGAEENSQPIAAENAATSSPISEPATRRSKDLKASKRLDGRLLMRRSTGRRASWSSARGWCRQPCSRRNWASSMRKPST